MNRTMAEACYMPLPSHRLRRVIQPERRPEEYESRPVRKGEAREARRIEEGFRMLSGEGVYDDEAE